MRSDISCIFLSGNSYYKLSRSSSSSAQDLPDNLLDDLCTTIVELINAEEDKTMTVRQLQRNPGSLRIYWNGCTALPATSWQILQAVTKLRDEGRIVESKLRGDKITLYYSIPIDDNSMDEDDEDNRMDKEDEEDGRPNGNMSCPTTAPTRFASQNSLVMSLLAPSSSSASVVVPAGVTNTATKRKRKPKRIKSATEVLGSTEVQAALLGQGMFVVDGKVLCDRASVNEKAMNETPILRSSLSNMIHGPCNSHTLSHTSEQAESRTPALNDFWLKFMATFTHNFATGQSYTRSTHKPTPKYSRTRWMAKLDAMKPVSEVC